MPLIKSDDLAVPNSTLCERWCDQWRLDGKLVAYPNWKCYHKPMITPQWIAEIREESEQIELQLGDLAGKLESLADHSKLDCSEDPRGVGQGNAIHDVASIHFDTKWGAHLLGILGTLTFNVRNKLKNKLIVRMNEYKR